jgi:hypothetical protein
VLGNLVFVAGAQLLIGAFYPMIDQAAHVGGLVVGALASLALSPGWRPGRSRAARAAATSLFVALVVLAGAALVATVRSAPLDTIERMGWERRAWGPVSVELPRGWVLDEEGAAAFEPSWMLSPSFSMIVIEASDAGAALKALSESLATQEDISAVVTTAAPAAPPGWSAGALRFTYAKGDRREVFHKLIFVRLLNPEQALVVSLLAPAERRDVAAALAPRILGSVRIDEP